MIDILALLKRLSISDNAICPICYTDYFHGMKYIHKEDCQLKAAIDALEDGRLVVVDVERDRV